MKAKIILTLDDSDNYSHSVSGNPINLAMLLHAFSSQSKRNKASFLIAYKALLDDEGKKAKSKEVMNEALVLLNSNGS